MIRPQLEQTDALICSIIVMYSTKTAAGASKGLRLDSKESVWDDCYFGDFWKAEGILPWSVLQEFPGRFPGWVKQCGWQITVLNLLNQVVQMVKRNPNFFPLSGFDAVQHSPQLSIDCVYAFNPSPLLLFHPSKPRLNRLSGEFIILSQCYDRP